MNSTSTTSLALALALTLSFGSGGCDKSTDADTKAKPEAQPKAEPPAADSVEPAKPDAAKPADSIEVAAGDRVDIQVDAAGYHPATISAPAQSKITLAFKRTTNSGCGQELVVESMGLQEELPLDTVVEIEVEVPATGELKFACGMDMYQGKVVAR